jgi:thiosulfate/3-mercaptopyruvate sulfurtransferase
MKDPIVSVTWLQEHLTDPNLIILDGSLKTNQADLQPHFKDVQIKGARFFDIKNEFSDTANPLPNTLPNPADFTAAARKLGVNNNSKIVVYDDLGIYSSPRVWWLFTIMGHENVWVLDGGLPEWVKNDYPVEKLENRTFTHGDFEAKFKPELVKTKEQILENIQTKEAVLIDARSEDRFLAIGDEPRTGYPTGARLQRVPILIYSIIVAFATRVFPLWLRSKLI